MNKELFSVNRLFSYIEECVLKSDIISLNKSIELYKKIMDETIRSSKRIDKSRVFASDIGCFNQICSLLESNNLYELEIDLLKWIAGYCDSNNSLLFYFDVSFSKLIRKIFESSKQEEHFSLVFNFVKYLSELKYFIEYYKEIVRYYTNIIVLLADNQSLYLNTKKRLLKSYISFICSFSFMKDDDKKLHKAVAYSVLRNILIYSNRESYSSDREHVVFLVLSNVYTNNKLGFTNSSQKEDFVEVIVLFTVYLYYLLHGDEMIKDTVQYIELAKLKIIDMNAMGNNSVLQFILQLEENIWIYFNSVMKELVEGDWEYLPINTVKSMTIGDVIEEFFINFSKITIRKISKHKRFDYFKEVNPRFLFSLLDHYTSSSNTTRSNAMNKMYGFLSIDEDNVNTIKKIFFNESYKNDYIINELLTVYKDRVINDAIKSRSLRENILTNKKQLIDMITFQMKDSQFFVPDLKKGKVKKFSPISILTDYLSSTSLVYGYDDLGKSFMELFFRMVTDILSQDAKKVYINDDDFLVVLRDHINLLFSSDESTVVLNSELTKLSQIEFSNDVMMIEYYREFQKKSRFLPTNLYLPVLITSSDIEIEYNIMDISVTETNIEDKEIEEYKDNETGLYRINITNSIYVQMNEDELRTYVNNHYHQLTVSLVYRITKPEKIISISYDFDA